LHEITALSLLSQQLKAVKDRNELDTSKVDDVIMGCVSPVAGQGADIARSATIKAGYAQTTAGVTLNRFCGSGLEFEEMAVPQGISADLIATMNGFSRDDVDAYAVESQKRAAKAWEEGRFKKSIVPVKDQLGVTILDHDEHMRPTSDMQSLGSLNPAFAAMGTVMPGFDPVAIQRYPEVEKINHVHHAGNSSGIVDGAAAILIGSKEMGESLGLKARARIKAFAEIGSEPTIMLTGPEFVAAKALKKAGMEVDDIDLYELNEAFAAVVLRFMKAHNIEHDKINVNGGAIAMGHPLGATGAMILGTMVDELERSNKETSLITLCIGGGMGTATIIERV